jgi:8-amino-7-oxononanoate synthase
MTSFDSDLSCRLDALREQGLYRELRRIDSAKSPRIVLDGKSLLNFSSNDYLGLANEPSLKSAACEAIERYGAGTGGSRLICGSLAPHHELDELLAQFKGTEAALSFSTGYAAALGTICALVGKGDLVVIDKLVHASIVDAARLSGATLRVFAHNDLADLETILKWGAKKIKTSASAAQSPRTLVVTESVFSMDGDHSPLRDLVELKEKYGVWLMVDEAHATGLYGPSRRGLAEALGVSDRIEVQMGTLGKAIGASGGYIAGSRTFIDYLTNRSRSFIFSTAPVPAAAAAATAGIRFVQSRAGAERLASLQQRIAEFHSEFKPERSGSSRQAETAGNLGPQKRLSYSAIIPVIIGDEAKAVEAAAHLRNQGIFIPAVRYPTVARGTARLRLTFSAAHTAQDIQQLLSALRPILPSVTNTQMA